MSIFSSIKKSRQSAKSHNAKLAEQKKIEESATTYRHVPTHAAADAIASAPPGWRDADKPRIVEQNRRRSAMAASGHHMNMPGTPRIGSSLSYVAYPLDGSATPVVPPLPRAYSHTGVANLQSQAMYGVPQMAYSQPYSLKGKEMARWPIYETPDQDPGYGKDAQSVAESSSESSSSRDNLEMRSAQPNTHAIGMAETRWHPSPTRSRRKSDPLTEQHASVNPSRSGHAIPPVRDSRPPPSTRGFNSIPWSAAPPPLLGARLPGNLPGVASPASAPAPTPRPSGLTLSPLSTSGHSEHAVQLPQLKSSRDSSAASLPGLTPTSSRVPPSAPATPGANTNSAFEFPFPAVASPITAENGTASLDSEIGGAVKSISSLPATSKPKERRASRASRFTEMERMASPQKEPPHSAPRMNAQDIPSPLSRGQVVNTFPEVFPVTSDPDNGNKAKGDKKPRKAGNKLVKKPRVASSASGK